MSISPPILWTQSLVAPSLLLSDAPNPFKFLGNLIWARPLMVSKELKDRLSLRKILYR